MRSVTLTEVEALQNVLVEVLMEEWQAQGHYMTGAVIKDMEWDISQTPDTITLSGLMYPYANIIASGVKKDKIPFSGITGRGGTSAYIDALRNWVRLKMNIEDDKKSLSIAFAIAHTQKKYGMPTPASVFYSTTGQRTEWTSQSLEKNMDKIVDVIATWSRDQMLIELDTILDRWQVEISKQ